MHAQVAPNRYRVFFVDKNNNNYTINAPEQFLSEKAINRRLNQGIEIRENDLPVSKLYVDSLKSAELEDHVAVIGTHRVGGEIVRFLKREKHPIVVLDFNPHQVEILLAEGIPVIYGDMSDPEVLDILNLDTAKMIISTTPDLEANKTLLEDLKLRKINTPVIVRAESVKEAQSLYKRGADLVVLPEVMAGDLLLDILKDHLNEKSYFKDRPRIELEKLSRKILSWG